MKKTLLGMLALAISATAAAAQPSVTASLSSGKLSAAPVLRQQDGFSALQMEGVENTWASKARMAKSQTRGDEKSLDFSLAFEAYTALKMNNPQTGAAMPVGSKFYQAFEMSAANRKLYAGKTITSINICAPVNDKLSSKDAWVNDITTVRVFMTHDLNGEFFYDQKGTLGKVGFEQYKITLDTPYVIEEDKPLYIGYYAKIQSTRDYYLVIDGVPRESLDGGYCAVVKGSTAPVWQNIANQNGNLCIGATIEGEGLPENGVSMYGIELPTYVEPGQPFTFDVGFVGAACNDAQSVEIEYTIGGQAPESLTIPFDEKNYLGFNELAIYTIKNVICNEQGSSIPFDVKITKVNGQPNVSTDNKASGDFQCFEKKLGYTHRYVVEEATGTWCLWCPQGFVMMEYLKEKYPEQFIRVAVHGGDEMAVNSTSSVITMFGGSYPSAMVDRTYDCMLGYSGVDVNAELTNYYEANKDIPAIADVDLKVNVEAGAKKVSIPTTVKFAADGANANRYRLAYYVVENNVGPYDQRNNYAGGSMGAMGGWENKPNPASTIYEDVARNLVGTVTGLANSLPGTIKAGEAYDYTGSASITNVVNDEFIVVAMVIDSNTLRILNAKQVTAYKSSGVESVVGETAEVRVRGAQGAVLIDGDYASASVYSVSGQLVATSAGEASISLPAGIYIVKADGVVAKVMVN